MKHSWKFSIISLILLFGIMGLIHGKTDPAQTLFSPQVADDNNAQALGPLTAQQLTALFRQHGITGNSGMAAATIPPVVHRASGDFNIGGAIILDISGGPTMANFPFILAFSLFGDYPGIVIGGIGQVPLNPPYLNTFFGLLDGNGEAQLIIPIPPDPSLLGLPLTSVVGVFTPSGQILISNPASYTIGQGIAGYTCCREGVRGHVWGLCYEGVSQEYCDQIAGGAVQECVPVPAQQNVIPGPPAPLTEGNTTSTFPFILQLLLDAYLSGIPARTYVNDTYDCDDFADDMEQYLEGLGYNATYTILEVWKNSTNPDYGHVVTDVHLPETLGGGSVFVEPQTGALVNLDFNNNSRVNARLNPNPYPEGYRPTENQTKITVYDSASDASAAGAPRD